MPATLALHNPHSGLLMETIRVIGNGDALPVVPVQPQLLTQQAADLLNVSPRVRQFVADFG